MDKTSVYFLAAFALMLQFGTYQANTCNRRSTVVEIKIPKRMNVTIKYPPNADPVKFVPYPYKSQENNPTCYQCDGSTCHACNGDSQNNHVHLPPVTKTNIIIDVTRKNSDLPTTSLNATKANKTDTTTVLVESEVTATSGSKSLAKGKSTSAAATSSTSTTDSEVLAAFDQNTPTNNGTTETQDVYVETASQSTSNSTAIANSDPGTSNPVQQNPSGDSTPKVPIEKTSKDSAAENPPEVATPSVPTEDKQNADKSAGKESKDKDTNNKTSPTA